MTDPKKKIDNVIIPLKTLTRRKTEDVDDVRNDQAILTDKELKEEITRVLTANNPHAPHNIVRYSFKERMYKIQPIVDQLAVHYSMEGTLLHIDSEEAKLQMAREALAKRKSSTHSEIEDGSTRQLQFTESFLEKAVLPEKKLMNQFNYCERASQTINNIMLNRGTETEPPPRAAYGAQVTQWIIYDDYCIDMENQEKNKKAVVSKKAEGRGTKRANNTADAYTDELYKTATAMNICERMVNQNTFDDIMQDFKYYEDESDEYRDGHGTLLPLWRFQYDKARKMCTTALCWSTKYYDIFAVGFGSYEFMKQISGVICFYSLKNPSYPAFTFQTEKGVLCLDLHPSIPHMLCVGFNDGGVGVYSLIQNQTTPLYLSNSNTGKHTDPVWQVRWQKQDDQQDNNINFYSVSADSRITIWTLVKDGVGQCHECPNDLVFHDVLKLEVKVEGGEGALALSCGTTFDFHPKMTGMFLVATEEGMVYKCSQAFSSHFLNSWKAHYMAVYRVAWNTFHPDIFITCSADWTVKVWNHKKPTAQYVFDLNSPVGDVAWAPYSSTVFAAVTADGKVVVFDLSVNKYEPICEQVIVSKKKTKLTHICFNPKYPILIVGDDKGHVITLKLSPNLRKLPKEKKGIEQVKGPELEIQKLDALLEMVG